MFLFLKIFSTKGINVSSTTGNKLKSFIKKKKCFDCGTFAFNTYNFCHMDKLDAKPEINYDKNLFEAPDTHQFKSEDLSSWQEQ